MLAECNKNVYNASQAIKSLYIACMLEQEPPEMLVLEQLTDKEVDQCDPLVALQVVGSTQVEHGAIVSGSNFGDDNNENDFSSPSGGAF
jgi:hypothetical protein